MIIKKPPTAVLNAIQILGIFFLSSCLRSRGDDPLKIAGLEAFHRAKAFADLAAVAAGDSGFLVTIEHTYEMVQGSFNAPTEKTIWRFWTPEKDTVTLREKESVTFREAAHGSVVMPTAKAIVMTLQGNRLLALLQVNEPVPAFLLSWDDIKGPAPGLGPPQISSTPSRAVPVELGEHEASMVLVDYAQDWSTRTLPSSRWLFHPSLSSLPDLPGVVMALNTSDARAVVWRSDGAQKPKTPLVFLERALNPVLKPLEGRTHLFYREAPPNWSVYFHDTRYSGKYGHIALPLMDAEVEGGGKIVHVADVSKDRAVGPVFDFAVDSDSKNRFALAAIAGSKQYPELRLYVSDDQGNKLRLRKVVALRQIPYRLSMALVGGSEVLLGLAYLGPEAYEVEGMLVPWQ